MTAQQRFAFKFGYHGPSFEGFQRQEGTALRTVEGEIIKALSRSISDTEVKSDDNACDAIRFRSAGRTDRDVSAVSNCCEFSSPLDPVDAMNMLNARVPGVYFHSYAEVDDTFNPRHAKARTYRYFLPPFYLQSQNVKLASQTNSPQRSQRDTEDGATVFQEILDVIELFVGQHDFSAFARVEEHRSPVRVVLDVTGSVLNSAGERDVTALPYVDITGESFLWNQIRRMIGAALAVCSGRHEKQDIANALANPSGANLTARTAPARFLLLRDVRYDGMDFVRPVGLRTPSWYAERFDAALCESALFGIMGQSIE